MVAVGAGVSEHVHTAIAELYRQGVGMGVRGDAEVSVRAAVATAPDLRATVSIRPQQRYPGIGEPRGSRQGPTLDVMGGTGQAADDRAGWVCRHPRPPIEPTEECIAERQQ